jgi:lysophospholipase L1-like esterase
MPIEAAALPASGEATWTGHLARWTIRVGLLCGVTVAALVAAEDVLRFQYRHARTSGNAGDFVARTSAWSPGPSNSLGFREREIPGKSPERYRIAVVGDSFTWGQGIERDERFSNRLERMLGPRYEVLNFGIPGDNMPEHLTRLEPALSVSPDFVLLQLYINDFETAAMARPRAYPLFPGSLGHALEGSSILYELVQNQWMTVQGVLGLSETYVHYMGRSLGDPNGSDSRAAFGQLREFFDRARAAGVPAGAVLFPATDSLAAHGRVYPFGYLHDGVQRSCVAAQVRCLDLFHAYSRFPDPRAMWVSPFDAHPNGEANRIAADEMLREFETAWRH